ncbi:MAG: hypothetical protein JWP50_2700 [Phenylobacterium sp.]|nr:hypothetical protein [Phenylobacterium sp.]
MKTQLAGAGVALVAGLLMGAAAKPDLNSTDRPEGPQMLAGWGGARGAGPFGDGATFANYSGQVPDYVLGTDWKKALIPQPVVAEPSPPAARLAQNDEPLPDLSLTQATYDEAPRAPPSYPSVQGGQTSGSALLPPAHPDGAG